MTVQPRASLHTIGCRLNQSETALLASALEREGYRLVSFGEPTELLILNTCSVTESAEADCRYAIRRTLRHSPHAFIAATGCYAQTGAHSLRRIAGVDLVVGMQYKMRLPAYLPPAAELRKEPDAVLVHTRTIDREEFVLPGVGAYSSKRANLKIQDGCDFMCSFCIIPFARGHERTREPADVLREARELVIRGHRELVLTGVNIGRYHAGQVNLLGLIRRLEDISGLERIRISSIEPTTISDDLLEHMARSPKLCRHLHVPLQSGDDGILEAMHRRYRVQDYRAFIEKVLALIPDIGIGSDVMVGFPGEGTAQFENTARLLSELPFAYFHVFSFSKRPGTAAVRMPNGVGASTVKKRSRLLAQLSRTKRSAFYQRHIGQTVRVLFETQDEHGFWTGLTSQFMRVGVKSGARLTNEFHDVLITGNMDGLAFGEMVVPEKTRVSLLEFHAASQ
jgi:threonylcarbamoyladenosine tRNA methylthiotransferase MtaB